MAELLRLEALEKSFGAVRATRQVSLGVQGGEVHALIGPNGAGKTTLIAQIAGTLRPDSGQIFLAGQEITDLRPHQRAASGLVRTFQVASVVPGFSTLRNMMLASQALARSSFRFWRPAMRDDAGVAHARAALDRVGLGDRAERAAATLSHGERRQLELGMALALEPRLLLLDEPMAGLGGEDARLVVTLLDSLKGRLTMLLVEHDMATVFKLADRVTVLVDGAVMTSGRPEEVRASSSVRAAYLGDDAC